MNRNLVGSIKERSSIDDYPFRPDPLINMTPQTILVSDWSISKKKSFLKQLCQLCQNLIGSIYGKPSIKITHFILNCS